MRVQYLGMDALFSLPDLVGRALNGAGAPKKLLVGVSGGADSVALLRAICDLRAKRWLQVTAVHVHHGLRERAEKDAAFVQDLCGALDVPLALERVRVEPSGSVEDAARRARYAAFKAVYLRAGAQALLLAHHMDDQAETALMHLLYGGGARGVSGMRAQTRVDGMLVLRPLLSVPRRALKDYLTELSQPWREDESNLDPRYTRNFLRVSAFPALETRFPGAREACARFARILSDEDDLLDGLARDFLRENASDAPCRFLMLSAFAPLHIALKRRAVRLLASEAGDMDFATTERVIMSSGTPGTIENLPRGFRTLATQKRLHILPPLGTDKPPALNIGDWLLASPVLAPSDGKRSQAIPRALFEGAALRFRAPGDFIHPFGAPGKKPLSDYLTDHKVDPPFRDHLPILFQGREALFVLGVGASERLRLPPGAQDALQLTVTHPLPWDLHWKERCRKDE